MEPEAKIGLKQRLANRLYPVALLIWLLVSVGFPAIYYILEVNDRNRNAIHCAEDISDKLENLVLKAPDRWKEQNQKYTEILSNVLQYNNEITSIQILDEKGQSIPSYKYQTQKANAWWNRNASFGSASIIFNKRSIATVEVKFSQRDILEATLRLFILSTVVGSSLAFLVYSLPINVTSKTEKQIQDLIKEIQSSQAESDRLRVAAQLSEQRLGDLIQGVDAIVWEADAATGKFTFVSQRAVELLGYPIEQWLTSANFPTKYIHPDEREEVVKLYQKAISQAKEQVIEYRAIAADKRILWLRDLVRVVKNKSGKARLLRGVIVDITKFKQAEQQLRHDALHDVLTGLPNRALFMQRLGKAVELSKRSQDYLFAVLFLDLDRFKFVNDSLGHKVGDQLLIEISRRLEMCIRACDTVARLAATSS